MRMLIGVVIAAVCVIGAGPPAERAVSEDDGCWICDDYETADGLMKHTDYQLFWNDTHGGSIHTRGAWGSCGTHYNYEKDTDGPPPPPPPGGDLAAQLSEQGRTEELLKYLVENENAQLNYNRSALQVIGAAGAVVVHIPLPKHQAVGLRLALSQLDPTGNSLNRESEVGTRSGSVSTVGPQQAMLERH